MPTIELFFDYTCPFAYLGSVCARSLAARTGASLVWRPVLLGGMLKAHGVDRPPSDGFGAAKRAHNENDMQRWAKHWGVPLNVPAAHPMRTVDALRATLATGIDPAVVDGFYRAYWVDGRDVAHSDVLGDVVSAAGHDAERVLREIREQPTKDELRRRTDEAAARGVFGVPTWIVDGGEPIWGQDRMHFVEKALRPARALDVYWDFASPFAYLGCTQVDALAARTGARVTWHPILLGALFRATGTADVPLATYCEAKQRHVARDLERWAAHLGVPFRFPSRFPTRSLDALRVYLALPEARRSAFRDAVFRAYWAEDRDIADRGVLAACIGDDAVAADALARAQSDDVKGALRAETDAAVARGVFGVPTFVVDARDLYWGQDRLVLVEQALTSA